MSSVALVGVALLLLATIGTAAASQRLRVERSQAMQAEQ